MFDRGKRDEVQDPGAEPREPQRSFDTQPARPTDRKGECAVIGRSIQIEGAVRGNEDLRIEGDVSGTVELKDSSLTIGKEGKVRADVYAKSIIVDGSTEGDLYATERIVVHVNAQVRGNITAPKVGVEEGAKFKGSIEMDKEAVDKAFNKANLHGGSRQVTEPGTSFPDSRAAAKSGGKPQAAGVGPAAGAK
jgi:cytoskeletal protein CcmA (bactofilin family)